MKILQVVTFLSIDSEFGGPAQVALNLHSELNKGACAEILALSNQKTISSANVEIKDSHLFKGFPIIPRFGFAGIINLRLFIKFFQMRKSFDLIHIHLARDLVTLPVAFACLILRVPYLVQTHGMIDLSEKRLARILDFLFTRRVLRGSLRVLSLTKEEDADLLRIENRVTIERFLNGSQKSNSNIRENIIVFVGRLSFDKRPDLLVHAGKILLEANYDLEFYFLGPDSGMMKICKDVASIGNYESKFKFLGPVSNSDVRVILSKSKILVLPSPRDRFPLAVIEALSSATPVILSKGNGVCDYVSEYRAGVISELTGEDIASAIREILRDFDSYQANAKALFGEAFDSASNVANLFQIYNNSLLSHFV